MPRVIVTQGEIQGLSVCQQFLETKSPQAAKRAAASIAKYFLTLETEPEIGRPLADEPKLREGIIPFGEMVMWLYIILIKRTMLFIFWHFDTRKRQGMYHASNS